MLILELRATESASIEALTVRARRTPNGELASEQISQMDIYLAPGPDFRQWLQLDQLALEYRYETDNW